MGPRPATRPSSSATVDACSGTIARLCAFRRDAFVGSVALRPSFACPASPPPLRLGFQRRRMADLVGLLPAELIFLLPVVPSSVRVRALPVPPWCAARACVM